MKPSELAKRYWQLISGQKEGIQFYSKDECRALRVAEDLLENTDYVPVAGTVEGIELFDPQFWGISPLEARAEIVLTGK